MVPYKLTKRIIEELIPEYRLTDARKALSILTLAAILLSLAWFVVPAYPKIPTIKQDCGICHVTDDGGTLLLLKKAPSELCLDCHPDRKAPSEHVVDVIPSMDVQSLPLDNGKISCITCHDPHNSYFESMLRTSPEKLCGICHRY